MALRVTVARHGRTPWNRDGRRLGREDIALDDVGHEQARALQSALHGHRFDAVYSSPLRRAFSTAEPLAAARGVAVVVCDDLIEFDFGVASGTTRDERPLKLSHDHLLTAVEGGESLFDAWTRATRFRSHLAQRTHDGASAVVVTHRLIGKLVCAALAGLSFNEAVTTQQFRMKPGQYVEVEANADSWSSD